MTACARFYLLYGIITSVGVALGIVLSMRTQSIEAGFAIASFILASGNGMIGVLHSRHKRLCHCYAQSNVESSGLETNPAS